MIKNIFVLIYLDDILPETWIPAWADLYFKFSDQKAQSLKTHQNLVLGSTDRDDMMAQCSVLAGRGCYRDTG